MWTEGKAVGEIGGQLGARPRRAQLLGGVAAGFLEHRSPLAGALPERAQLALARRGRRRGRE
jgi:hypothetical protein